MVEWNPFHLENFFCYIKKGSSISLWFSLVFRFLSSALKYIPHWINSFIHILRWLHLLLSSFFIYIQYFLCCLHIFDVGVFLFYRYPSSLYTDCWFQHWMCIMHFTMETLVWWFTLWKLCKNVSGKNYKFHGALIFMHEKMPTINFANSGQWMTEAKMNEFMAKFQCALQWSSNARRLSFRMIYLVVILCS